MFSYNGEAITMAASCATATADELTALIGSCCGALATATGPLATVAALHECAGAWTDRVGLLGEDVRSVGTRLTDSLADYLRIDDEIAALLDGIF